MATSGTTDGPGHTGSAAPARSDPVPLQARGVLDGLVNADRFPVTVTVRLTGAPEKLDSLDGLARSIGGGITVARLVDRRSLQQFAELKLSVADSAEFWRALDDALGRVQELGLTNVGGTIDVGTAAFGVDVPAYLHLIELFYAHQDVLARMWDDPDGTAPRPVVVDPGVSGSPAAMVQRLGGRYRGPLMLRVKYDHADRVTFTVGGFAPDAGGLQAQIMLAAALVSTARARSLAGTPLQGWPVQAVGAHAAQGANAARRGEGVRFVETAQRLINLLFGRAVDRQKQAALFHRGAWVDEPTPGSSAGPLHSAGLGHLNDVLPTGGAGPSPSASWPQSLTDAAKRASPHQEPFVTVVRTLDPHAVIEAVVAQRPDLSGADAYWWLLRGDLAIPQNLLAAKVQSLTERIENLPATASDFERQLVFARHSGWSQLAADAPWCDEKSLVEICQEWRGQDATVADVRVDRDLGWLNETGSIEADRVEDLLATLPGTLSEISEFVKARIAAGKSPVPLLISDIADDAASRVPFGIELEFVLIENDPANPLTFLPKQERLVLIGRALYLAGLTRTPKQQIYHAGAEIHTTAEDGWRFEQESSVDGEIISPVLTLTPRAMRAIWEVLTILHDYGATTTVKTGLHIHRGVGVIGDSFRRAQTHPRDRVALSVTGAARGRANRTYIKYLAAVSRLNDYFIEPLLRIATNPAAAEHRGTDYASPYWTPAPGYRSDAEAAIRGRKGNKALRTDYIKYRASDHDEFRLPDAPTFRDPRAALAYIQTLVKLQAGLGLAPLGDDLPAMGPSPPTAPLGRFHDPLASAPPRINGWRVFGIETRPEATFLAQLLGTAFGRLVDMVQAAALFVINPWARLAARVDSGPRPPVELALLLADTARWTGLSYPREITLRLSSMLDMLDRLPGDLTAGRAYARALLPSDHPDALLTDDAMRELYDALATRLAAVPDVERPRWLMDRLAEGREQWQRLRDDPDTLVSDWRQNVLAQPPVSPGRRSIPGGHWLGDDSQTEWPHLDGMVTVAGRLTVHRGEARLGGRTARQIARWLNETYPAGWPGFRAVLLPVSGSGSRGQFRNGVAASAFGARVRAELAALGRQEAVLAARSERGHWTWYRSGGRRSTVTFWSLQDAANCLGHRIVPPAEHFPTMESTPVLWPTGRQPRAESVRPLLENPLENLLAGDDTQPPPPTGRRPARVRRLQSPRLWATRTLMRQRLAEAEDPVPLQARGVLDGLADADRFPVTVTVRLTGAPEKLDLLDRLGASGYRIHVARFPGVGRDGASGFAELKLSVADSADFWRALDDALGRVQELGLTNVGGTIDVGTAAFGVDVPAYLHLIELFYAHQDVLARMWDDPDGTAPRPVVVDPGVSGSPAAMVQRLGGRYRGPLMLRVKYDHADRVTFTVGGFAPDAGGLQAQIMLAAALVSTARARSLAGTPLQGWPVQAVGAHAAQGANAARRGEGVRFVETAQRLINLLFGRAVDRQKQAALFHRGAWVDEPTPGSSAGPLHSAGLGHLNDVLPTGGAAPSPSASWPQSLTDAAKRASPHQEPFVTVVRTLDPHAVIEAVVAQRPDLSGADAYWWLLRGDLAIPQNLLAAKVQSLTERIENLPATASDLERQQIFAPHPGWSELATDHERGDRNEVTWDASAATAGAPLAEPPRWADRLSAMLDLAARTLRSVAESGYVDVVRRGLVAEREMADVLAGLRADLDELPEGYLPHVAALVEEFAGRLYEWPAGDETETASQSAEMEREVASLKLVADAVRQDLSAGGQLGWADEAGRWLVDVARNHGGLIGLAGEVGPPDRPGLVYSVLAIVSEVPLARQLFGDGSSVVGLRRTVLLAGLARARLRINGPVGLADLVELTLQRRQPGAAASPPADADVESLLDLVWQDAVLRAGSPVPTRKHVRAAWDHVEDTVWRLSASETNLEDALAKRFGNALRNEQSPGAWRAALLAGARAVPTALGTLANLAATRTDLPAGAGLDLDLLRALAAAVSGVLGGLDAASAAIALMPPANQAEWLTVLDEIIVHRPERLAGLDQLRDELVARLRAVELSEDIETSGYDVVWGPGRDPVVLVRPRKRPSDVTARDLAPFGRSQVPVVVVVGSRGERVPADVARHSWERFVEGRSDDWPPPPLILHGPPLSGVTPLFGGYCAEPVRGGVVLLWRGGPDHERTAAGRAARMAASMAGRDGPVVVYAVDDESSATDFVRAIDQVLTRLPDHRRGVLLVAPPVWSDPAAVNRLRARYSAIDFMVIGYDRVVTLATNTGLRTMVRLLRADFAVTAITEADLQHLADRIGLGLTANRIERLRRLMAEAFDVLEYLPRTLDEFTNVRRLWERIEREVPGQPGRVTVERFDVLMANMLGGAFPDRPSAADRARFIAGAGQRVIGSAQDLAQSAASAPGPGAAAQANAADPAPTWVAVQSAVKAAVRRAFPEQDWYQVLLWTLSPTEALAEFVRSHRRMSGAQACRRLQWRELRPGVLAAKVESLYAALGELPRDASPQQLAAVFAPAAGWDVLLVDYRPIPEIVDGPSVPGWVAAAGRARNGLNAYEVILQTFNRDALLADLVVTSRPEISGAEAYRRLMRGELFVAQQRMRAQVHSLIAAVSKLPTDASPQTLAAVFRPADGWAELANDNRPLREIVPVRPDVLELNDGERVAVVPVSATIRNPTVVVGHDGYVNGWGRPRIDGYANRPVGLWDDGEGQVWFFDVDTRVVMAIVSTTAPWPDNARVPGTLTVSERKTSDTTVSGWFTSPTEFVGHSPDLHREVRYRSPAPNRWVIEVPDQPGSSSAAVAAGGPAAGSGVVSATLGRGGAQHVWAGMAPVDGVADGMSVLPGSLVVHGHGRQGGLGSVTGLAAELKRALANTLPGADGRKKVLLLACGQTAAQRFADDHFTVKDGVEVWATELDVFVAGDGAVLAGWGETDAAGRLRVAYADRFGFRRYVPGGKGPVEDGEPPLVGSDVEDVDQHPGWVRRGRDRANDGGAAPRALSAIRPRPTPSAGIRVQADLPGAMGSAAPPTPHVELTIVRGGVPAAASTAASAATHAEWSRLPEMLGPEFVWLTEPDLRHIWERFENLRSVPISEVAQHLPDLLSRQSVKGDLPSRRHLKEPGLGGAGGTGPGETSATDRTTLNDVIDGLRADLGPMPKRYLPHVRRLLDEAAASGYEAALAVRGLEREVAALREVAQMVGAIREAHLGGRRRRRDADEPGQWLVDLAVEFGGLLVVADQVQLPGGLGLVHTVMALADGSPLAWELFPDSGMPGLVWATRVTRAARKELARTAGRIEVRHLVETTGRLLARDVHVPEEDPEVLDLFRRVWADASLRSGSSEPNESHVSAAWHHIEDIVWRWHAESASMAEAVKERFGHTLLTEQSLDVWRSALLVGVRAAPAALETLAELAATRTDPPQGGDVDVDLLRAVTATMSGRVQDGLAAAASAWVRMPPDIRNDWLTVLNEVSVQLPGRKSELGQLLAVLWLVGDLDNRQGNLYLPPVARMIEQLPDPDSAWRGVIEAILAVPPVLSRIQTVTDRLRERDGREAVLVNLPAGVWTALGLTEDAPGEDPPGRWQENQFVRPVKLSGEIQLDDGTSVDIHGHAADLVSSWDPPTALAADYSFTESVAKVEAALRIGGHRAGLVRARQLGARHGDLGEGLNAVPLADAVDEALAGRARDRLEAFLDAVWQNRTNILASRDSSSIEDLVYQMYARKVKDHDLTADKRSFLNEILAINDGRPGDSEMLVQTDEGLRALSELRFEELEQAKFIHFYRAGVGTRDTFTIRVVPRPDAAAALMRALVHEVVDGERFPRVYGAKVATPRELPTRSDPIVIYLDGEAAAARVVEWLDEYWRNHPGVFDNRTPGLTVPVRPGELRGSRWRASPRRDISEAGISVGATPRERGTSYGWSRTEPIAAALQDPAVQGDRERFRHRARQLLAERGIDLRAPHRELDPDGPTGPEVVLLTRTAAVARPADAAPYFGEPDRTVVVLDASLSDQEVGTGLDRLLPRLERSRRSSIRLIRLDADHGRPNSPGHGGVSAPAQLWANRHPGTDILAEDGNGPWWSFRSGEQPAGAAAPLVTPQHAGGTPQAAADSRRVEPVHPNQGAELQPMLEYAPHGNGTPVGQSERAIPPETVASASELTRPLDDTGRLWSQQLKSSAQSTAVLGRSGAPVDRGVVDERLVRTVLLGLMSSAGLDEGRGWAWLAGEVSLGGDRWSRAARMVGVRVASDEVRLVALGSMTFRAFGVDGVTVQHLREVRQLVDLAEQEGLGRDWGGLQELVARVRDGGPGGPPGSDLDVRILLELLADGQSREGIGRSRQGSGASGRPHGGLGGVAAVVAAGDGWAGSLGAEGVGGPGHCLGIPGGCRGPSCS